MADISPVEEPVPRNVMVVAASVLIVRFFLFPNASSTWACLNGVAALAPPASLLCCVQMLLQTTPIPTPQHTLAATCLQFKFSIFLFFWLKNSTGGPPTKCVPSGISCSCACQTPLRRPMTHSVSPRASLNHENHYWNLSNKRRRPEEWNVAF